MFRELFSGNPANVLAIGGLLFFVAIFVTVLVWIASRRRTPHFARMARLPVDEVSAPAQRGDR